MKPTFAILLTSVVMWTAVWSTVATGQTAPEPRYFVRPISEIKLTDDEGNSPDVDWLQRWSWDRHGFARAALDQSGHAVLAGDVNAQWDERIEPVLAIETTDGGDSITGMIVITSSSSDTGLRYRFEIDASEFVSAQADFLQARYRHYQSLLQSRNAGSAWYRFQMRESAAESGQPLDEGRPVMVRESELDRSFALVTGGRAVSENLQLDRVLQIGEGDDADRILLDRIEGITVREFDWGPLVEGLDPPVDPLASSIPADQHALFVPSFEALVALFETGFATAGPFGSLVTGQSSSANTRQRYQDQLGLQLGTVQKLFGPRLIRSIAITGGDPYFPTGTDVAVLFEAEDGEALLAAVQASIAASTRDHSPEAVSGTIHDVAYHGFRTADRRVSSVAARIDNVVVVSNSLTQLERLVATAREEQPSLDELDEYRFFRDRYRRDDANETALLIISDATIRRWCGPHWRIATSRRTRAAALMADLHARYMDRIVEGAEESLEVEAGARSFDMNEYSFFDRAAVSATWGTLEFQTPVSELTIDEVSREEARGYEQWRRGYQSNWSGGFDPIALRLDIAEGGLRADLTVMPLIDNSEYNRIVEVSEGAKIDPLVNSPHDEALIWGALALNTESEQLQQFANMGVAFTRVNFLDWLGDAVVVYVDQDPLWKEMNELVARETNDHAARAQEIQNFIQANVHRLPVALEVNVASSMKLTASLVAIRAFIEQSAPDMTVWETRRHLDKAYVRIGPSDEARRGLPDDLSDELAVYYYASGRSMIITLSEAVIHRAIGRIAARGETATDDTGPTGAEPPAMAGDNLVATITGEAATTLNALFSHGWQNELQHQSWSNLAILNEWKRLYPDRDPLELDRMVWKRELLCPGGGEYRWNEEWKTMESTVFGHPGQPRFAAPRPILAGEWQLGRFGLTFEHDGLRARAELDRLVD